MDLETSKIGIAIATFNSARNIEGCLASLAESGFTVVVFDDGSTDDTVAKARRVMPRVEIVEGDGTNWWAGGTQRALERCLELGCTHVLLLNPDAWIDVEGVRSLVAFSAAHPTAIPAALVIQRDQPSRIAWAGSRRETRLWMPGVVRQRYVAAYGAPLASAPSETYEVDEVHGRGVLLGPEVLRRIHGLDPAAFPHYGADNDLSLRAAAAGIRMFVLPHVHVTLDTRSTGNTATPSERRPLRRRLRNAYLFVTDRKHGEAGRMLWNLYSRHYPTRLALPSYAYHLASGVLRRLMR